MTIADISNLLARAVLTLENIDDERGEDGPPYKSAALESLIAELREAAKELQAMKDAS